MALSLALPHKQQQERALEAGLEQGPGRQYLATWKDGIGGGSHRGARAVSPGLAGQLSWPLPLPPSMHFFFASLTKGFWAPAMG